jgi:3',5'-cyclic AMP phosphodiesterase CpdA
MNTAVQCLSSVAIAGVVPVSVVKVAFANPGADSARDFSFACISDAHLQQIRGNQFVARQEQALQRAVSEINQLHPRPDFVMFAGDLAQLGSRAELDHGANILSGLRSPLRMVMGEHDYYLDLGEHWRNLFGEPGYSFDHKGVHFIVLNSILTCEDWTLHRWQSAERRMAEMTGLDSPRMSPFMVGPAQRQWLQQDLDNTDKTTPIVVLSHAPLQKIRKDWNFWTDDADILQAMLAPFEQVNVIYGHVHQRLHSRVGNIQFNSVEATAWPWPSPQSARQAGSHLPVLTLPMRSATGPGKPAGWQLVNLHNGRVDVTDAPDVQV